MVKPLVTECEVFPGRGGSAAVFKQVTETVWTGFVCDCTTPVHTPKDPPPHYGEETSEEIMARRTASVVENSGMVSLKRLTWKINNEIQLVHETVMKLEQNKPSSRLYGLSAILFRVTLRYLTLYCWGDVRFFAQLRDGAFYATPDSVASHEAQMYRFIDICFRRASKRLGISRTTEDPIEREQLRDAMWECFGPILALARDRRIHALERRSYRVLNGQPGALRPTEVKLPTAQVEMGAVLDDGLYEYCGRVKFATLPDQVQSERNLTFIRQRGLKGQVNFLDDEDEKATSITHVRGKADRAGIVFRLRRRVV